MEKKGLTLEIPGWGTLTAKQVLRPDGSRAVLPEYEACRRIAKQKGLPLKDIYSWVMSRNKS